MADYSTLTIEPGGMARFTRADHFNVGDSGDAVAEFIEFLVLSGYLTDDKLGEDTLSEANYNAAAKFAREQGLPDPGGSLVIGPGVLRAARTVIQDSGVVDNSEAYTGNAGGYELLADFGPRAASAG